MIRTRWIWIPGILYICVFAVFTYRQNVAPGAVRPTGTDAVSTTSDAVTTAAASVTIPREAVSQELKLAPALDNAGVLLLCYNRPEYLQKTLTAYFGLREASRYPLYLSQHGKDPRVTLVAEQAQQGRSFVHHWHAPRSKVPKLPNSHHVAQHYKYALDMAFREHSLDYVIIIEDDMEFSVDFLNMFEQTAWLLGADPSLLCISSWNDNAKAKFHPSATRFFRTSYFPGLGWMISKRTYVDQLQSQWPTTTHWDNWIRANFEKDCVAPFQSRNHNIGAKGSSVAQSFYNKYLKDNMWYSGRNYVDYGDLSYLLLANYQEYVRRLITSAVLITTVPIQAPKDPIIMLMYSSATEYKGIANVLSIWDPPRAEFQSVQLFTIWETHKLLLVDQRFSPLLPTNLAQNSSLANINVMPGEQGKDCVSVCRASNMQCDPLYFPYLSSCITMKRFFPCSGCIAEIGKDIPSYVSGDLPSRGKCVVADKSAFFACQGQHAMTTRLCPCKPM